VAEAPARGGRGATRIGPVLTWFAVLGGAGVWSVYTVVLWGLDEIACSKAAAPTGPELLGVPFTPVAAVITAAAAAVAGGAALAAWLVLRAARSATGALEERRAGRLRLMGVVGLISDVLYLAGIVYVGIALAYFGPCIR
jgi:hypothetical protein